MVDSINQMTLFFIYFLLLVFFQSFFWHENVNIYVYVIVSSSIW